MKKFLKRSLTFGGYLLLVLLLVELLLAKLFPDNDRYALQYRELADKTVHAKMVIFGSSKAVRGLDPGILEEVSKGPVYNFGLNGSNPEFLYRWYTRIFEQNYGKPDVVLLEVSWFMFYEGWMWRKLEQDSRYFTGTDFISMLLTSSDKSTLFFNRYHLFHIDLANTLLGAKDSDRAGEITDLTYHGFTPYTGTSNNEPYADSIAFDPTEQRQYLGLLLDRLINDGIKVIMVNLPENMAKGFSKTQEVQDNLAYIKKLAEDKNISFIDYQNEELPDSLFYNWNHLNLEGARLISGQLKDRINR